MPVNVSIPTSVECATQYERTVSLDPQLSLGYLVSPSVYVGTVVGEGNDVADFDLVFVVVEHEVAKSILCQSLSGCSESVGQYRSTT
jgi:hypothetical protein